MKNFLAFFVVVGAAFYMDTESSRFFEAFILPLILVLGLAVLLWWKGFVAVVIMGIAIFNSNLESTLTGEGVVWPMVAVVSGIYLVFWMAKKAMQQRIVGLRGTGGHHGAGSDFWDAGGGGCDGGGGGE